jgi:hypothetical protein
MDRPVDKIAATRLAVVALAAMLAACSTSKETGSAAGGGVEDWRKYEADFRPSDYDPETDTSAVKQASPEITQPGQPTDSPSPAAPELVSGFRVQFFSTTNIDEANAKKADIEARFPQEWFYLEYDPPTYKIRAGNFLSRFEADRFAKQLSENGFPNAWSVPTRVFKHPPPVERGLPPPPR